MAGKRKFQAIKGTRDLLPPETELWNRVEQTAREVFGTFGFGEIRLPVIEDAELFARSIGAETDVIAKEMFNVQGSEPDLVIKTEGGIILIEVKESLRTDRPQLEMQLDRYRRLLEKVKSDPSTLVRKENWMLRPEATASVCRAYIEHGMQALTQPVKLYYMGPMFRRERPQKGRYRQFYQIGAEVLETVPPNQDATKTIGKDAAVDAEVIEMVMAYFARLGLEGVQLDINSIGHSAPECRRGYVEKLKAELEKVKDKLGADSQRRIETNPLRVLDSKLESEQATIEKLPRIGDSLCADCAKHYAEVKRQLELRGVAYQENWRLVRGLDYYMRTTFEITARGLGSQNAVCGGGRYDGLVELLGGPPTKGIGFAIGEDRVILSLQESRKNLKPGSKGVYIVWIGEKAHTVALSTAAELREKGFRVELPPVEQKVGKALSQADRLGTNCAVILGENEISSGNYTVKVLSTGTQEPVPKAKLVKYLSDQFV
ncbi:MAG: histidine--tRNA ligase [Candidatus Acidiferrum sp.]